MTLEDQFRADMKKWPKRGFYAHARDAIARGHYRLITTDGQTIYLARIYLLAPVSHEDGFESGCQTLLHRIYQPDSERAMHDHPWRFESEILAGGYSEVTEAGERWLGEGDRVKHEARDLHRIARVAPNTWTRVHTGPREREWGFWVPWRDFARAPA